MDHNHRLLSTSLEQTGNSNQRYLYGIYKLHKEPPGVRWLAGNHLAETGQGDYRAPACTLSPTEAAVGGVLRLVMSSLEDKDRKLWRPRGVKRNWIVTSVDPVARDLHKDAARLFLLPVCTRDFTTMYTNLGYAKIIQEVMKAVRKALSFVNSGRTSGKQCFELKFDRQGKVTATFSKDGVSVEQVERYLRACVEEVYLQVGQGTGTSDGR